VSPLKAYESGHVLNARSYVRQHARQFKTYELQDNAEVASRPEGCAMRFVIRV